MIQPLLEKGKLHIKKYFTTCYFFELSRFSNYVILPSSLSIRSLR